MKRKKVTYLFLPVLSLKNNDFNIIMIHARLCSCFDCKNGYTPITDRADYFLRDWRKPTGKRKNIEVKKIIIKAWKEGKKMDEDFNRKINESN